MCMCMYSVVCRHVFHNEHDITAATKDSALCCKAWLLLMKVQPDMIPSFDVSGMIAAASCTVHIGVH